MSKISQSLHRAGFELPHPFLAHTHLLPDLFQRLCRKIAGQPVASLDDFSIALVKLRQNIRDPVCTLLLDPLCV